MILQALKNMYPKASEKALKAVMKDLEKCRGKNMSTEELADWIGKLVTAHIIEEALRITEDDSKPSQVGDESVMSRPLLLRRTAMKGTIEELWHGNIIPHEDSRTNSKEMKELLGYIARHHEDLEKSFTDEQKEIFEKFHDCWSEYASLAEEAIFAYAFKLGANLMLETLQ